MQIYRFHPSGQPTGSSAALRQGALNGQGATGSIGRDSEAEGAVSGGELDGLIRRLGEFSDVRPEVVAEAKVRVQRGDYLTRAAAEATADAILGRDAWTGFR